MDTTTTNDLKRTPIVAILLSSLKNFGLCFVSFILLLEIFKDKVSNLGSEEGVFYVVFFVVLILCLGVYIGVLYLFYIADKQKFHELDRKSLIERQMPLVSLFAAIPLLILITTANGAERELFVFVIPFYFSILFGYIFFIFDAKNK